MSWDALRDRDSGRPGQRDSRPGASPTPSLQPQSRGSLSPRSVRVRAVSKAPPAAEVAPAAIEEELWFGGHDTSIAEDAAARSMAALVGRIVGAKPFPESARKLADLTRKDVIRIEPIVQVLERDPALSVRLLRLVNSAGYALRQRCTSVRHAATLVGTDRLHQIATTAAVLDLFDARGSIAAKIVEHSTIVGAFCRYFGAHLALPVDDLFTAGFLHDIGKLMLLETEGDQYFALLEKYADTPDSIHIVERSLYGFDHAVLAAHVLTAWNIPDPVPKIVAWHHDPTRAYRVSSMMAALVQTVRLADSAVCAMVAGADQEQFAKLGSSESASYLDISEPQLSSMWDELQTLYRESVEQCRGENAPALDPRSLRPKQPLSIASHDESPRSTELPLQFPCVVCGHPTFGNKCSACGGHMCPEHQEGREDWCTLCARDFHHVSSEAPPAMSPRIALGVAGATWIISTAFGYETGGLVGAARAAVGTVLLILLAVLLAVAGRRLLLRFRFVRTRPNRAIEMPQESDGGTQSLVPPTTNRELVSPLSLRDPLTEQLRLSGAAIERVMIREVASVPSILAPKPFEGLAEASPPSSRHVMPAVAGSTAALASATSGRQPASRMDDERLALQSRSLVTLPVPREEPTALSPNDRTSARESTAIKPAESIDIDSGDRISELGLTGLPATPRSEPPPRPSSTGNDQPSPAAEKLEGHRSGTFPSQPPTAPAEPLSGVAVPADQGQSQHPLAALGLDPQKHSKHPARNSRGTAGTSRGEANPNKEPSLYSERQTLVGLSADEVRQALAAPAPPAGLAADSASAAEDVDRETLPTAAPAEPAIRPITVNPAPIDVGPEPTLDGAAQSRTAHVEPPLEELENLENLAGAVATHPDLAGSTDSPFSRSPSAEPSSAAESPEETIDNPADSDLEATIPLMPPSEPPQVAPRAAVATSQPPASPNPAPLGLSAAEPSIEQQMLAKMGPEFQAQVMALVAERVASIVAERMLESFGKPVASEAPSSRTPKGPKVKKAAAHGEALNPAAKASRKRAPRSG